MESREDYNVIKWNEMKLLFTCFRILMKEKTFHPIPPKVIKQIFSMVKTLKDLTHPNYKTSSIKIAVKIVIRNPKEETTSATNSIVS